MKSNFKVLGVMSGTSLDGIDLAECFFAVSDDGNWSYRLEETMTIAYPDTWKQRLREAIHFSEGRLRTLDETYTSYLGDMIATFLQRHKIHDLDAVCSHGHTILHQPENGRTLQIGNLPLLADRLKLPVVCDFRVQDVALGGQGAPLVPIGDRLLFPEFDSCLNLGGFANVSSESKGRRIAYDICPVNIVLNTLAAKLGKDYDENGVMARSGRPDQSLLNLLNEIPFYRQEAPKSLGLEWVQRYVSPLLEKSKLSARDLLATFTEHIAIQLSMQFEADSRILVTGGGAYNSFLLERLVHHRKVHLELPSKQLIEFKEALVFGLLGVLRLREEINCLASVTGATRDHCSGYVHVPENLS